MDDLNSAITAGGVLDVAHERAVFEQWILRCRMPVERNQDGDYEDLLVRHRWDAWIVRAAGVQKVGDWIGVTPHCGNCGNGVPGGPDNCTKCGREQQYSHWTPSWRKFRHVPAPVGPVLVTSASKVVWMADFAQSENVWRVGAGRDMVKLPPEAITHWMPLPVAAGLESADGVRVGARTALARFNESAADLATESPLERLRYFLSLALNGQDWLDVEPFLDALGVDVHGEGKR